MTSSIENQQNDGAPAPRWIFFSRGFRPFFLCAGLWSMTAMALWLVVLALDVELPGVLGPSVWHGHEMLYGYVVAVICGFLLTAIPNWTGRLPVSGWPLAGLSLLWLLGRIGLLLSDGIGVELAVAIDLSFLWLFLLLVLREVIRGRNWRNLPVAILVFILAVGNSLFHLDVLEILDSKDLALRLGLAVIIMLISLIGGRVVPSFTRNWLVKRGEDELPMTMNNFDKLVIFVTAVALIAWVAEIEGMIVSGLLILAGVMNLVRLWRWQPFKTTSEPLMWILHVGYAWLAVGLLLLGLTDVIDVVPADSGLHALTAGAVGSMTLAMMTRATLGHSGGQLSADRITSLIFYGVILAALSRTFLPMIEGLAVSAYSVSGVFWLVSFALFCWQYGPILLARKQNA